MAGSPIAALRGKYERIRALREAHGRPDEPDPRAAMAALAAEFPGALRELDRLTLHEITARITKLEAAEGDPTLIEDWMLAFVVFHRYARGALAVKRWLAAASDATAATDSDNDALDDDPSARVEARFRAALPQLCDEAALFATTLHEIAAPPAGRVMAVVYVRAANELGITEAELRALLHD